MCYVYPWCSTCFHIYSRYRSPIPSGTLLTTKPHKTNAIEIHVFDHKRITRTNNNNKKRRRIVVFEQKRNKHARHNRRITATSSNNNKSYTKRQQTNLIDICLDLTCSLTIRKRCIRCQCNWFACLFTDWFLSFSFVEWFEFVVHGFRFIFRGWRSLDVLWTWKAQKTNTQKNVWR